MALYISFFPNLKKAASQKNLAFALSFLFLIAFLFPACVQAEDDPFQFENTHWKSFDRYKEETKHGAVAVPETTESDTTSASVPTSNDMHDASGDSVSPITPPAMTPGVAAPTRPINVPVMPGMNKGYNVQVNSTEDERPQIAQITHIDTQPTVAIPDKNWQTPKEAVRRSSQGDEEDGIEEHQPLDVRMSFLPNTQITPVPSPEYKSSHGRKVPAAAIAAAPEPPPEKKAADLAACAAVDAYKKKQLEAIESDRQTLTALQKAIAQLGLQKELSFMAGANGNVSQADSSTAKMDMPPSLAKPEKN